MAKIELSREDIEEILGFKVLDWQWEYIKAFANKEKRIQWVQGRRGGRFEISEKLKEAMQETKLACGCLLRNGGSTLIPCKTHFNATFPPGTLSIASEDRPINVAEHLENFKAKRFSWDEYINVGDIPSVQNLKEEFEQLRKEGPKWSSAQYHRMRHIEEHLDKGELVCRCYKGGMRYETNDMG